MVSMFGSREWVDAGGLLSYGASLPGLYRRASGPLSQVCCEATARDAMMMNYKVFFITDANATLTDAEHGGTLSAMARTFCDVWVTQPAVPADRSDAGCDDQVAIRRTCIRLARYRGCANRRASRFTLVSEAYLAPSTVNRDAPGTYQGPQLR
jgi:hypothetical protein